MKRLLLFVVVNLLLITGLSSQQLLELKIIETHQDGEVSVSYDDGEYENDSIDKVDDDDLDMGWEGDDLNIMTAFTRFQNVTIPKGSTIDSAFLQLYAHEDESDQAIVKVYAEAIDNSPMFTESEALDDRTWTTTYLDWDITEPWTMWEPYRSPDLSAVIQEVIDRPGWESGNAFTLFMTGQDQGASLLDNARDFESFENIEDPDDGGDGLHHPERVPKITIYYTAPSTSPLELSIIETHKDGDVSVSYDDGEYENDSIDKVDDDDLDMGWEGDDLNIMTAFTRFQNVTIPQGANIDSAFLHIYAHEDESDQAIVKVYAEAIDNSPMFSESEALDDRTWTTTYLDWDITEPWTMWEPYRSPDLSAVIQEVIDRPGWESGNALTLFMTGQDQGASLLDNARDFESFENIEDPDDGGDGLHHPERAPKLTVYFSTAGVTSVNQMEVATFDIYPNPSVNGIFNVNLKAETNAVINVYNVTGSLVKSLDQVNGNVIMDLSEYTKGVYLVQVKQGNAISTQKVIVE